jgi:hypothetical protein
MKKIHALAIALVLAVSAGLGLAAATRTAGLRTATSTTVSSSNAVAARSHKLDRVEASLQRALRDKPPALPAVPAARRPAAAAPAQRVVYRRPAPIVVIKHGSHHGDDGSEHETEHGDD